MRVWIEAEVIRLTSIRAEQLRKGGHPGPEGSTGKLATGFGKSVATNPDLSAATRDQVTIALQAGVAFVPLDQAEAAAQAADLPADETAALLEDYGDSQLQALKLGLLVAAILAAAGWKATRRLPRTLDLAPDPDPDPQPSNS